MQDVFRSLVPFLDDKTFEKLHVAVGIPTLRKLADDKTFWKDRIETLTGRVISFDCSEFSLESHKDAYRILKRSRDILWNIEDNTLAILVLLSMLYTQEILYSSIKNAAANNCHKILKILLKNETIDEQVLCDSLLLASVRGHLESITLLLEDGRTDPSKNNKEVLWSSVSRSQYGSVGLLLKDKRMPELDQVEMDIIRRAISLNSAMSYAGMAHYISRYSEAE